MDFGAGTAVRLSGGYDFEPAWLGGRPGLQARLVKWIPGQNQSDACVVKLDDELTADGLVGGQRKVVTGRFAVLELRYEGDVWQATGTAHVELLESEPPSIRWGDRDIGAWVESHATYEFQS